MLILHETYDHWSVAVLTVAVHSSFFPTFDFFLKICCFLHWIQSVNPHFYVTLYYNGSPYIWPLLIIKLMPHAVPAYLIIRLIKQQMHDKWNFLHHPHLKSGRDG